MHDAQDNARWRRHQCINLIPSEQPTSDYVDQLMISEPAARYNEHNRAPGQPQDSPHIRYYRGTDFIMAREAELKDALRSFFNCRLVEPRVVSGQMANDTVFDALLQFRRDRSLDRPGALVHSLSGGGHLSAQPMGALKNYVARDAEQGKPVMRNFPSVAGDPYKVDVAATKQLIEDARPGLIVFGRSVILQTEPVRSIVDHVLGTFGADNPERPLVMYDGAHVLGLVGHEFQDPLAEGADILTGSTHKTFFGPQRGVILSNIAEGSVFSALWAHIEARTFPGHVSNHHLGTMLGLLGATYEMSHFKSDYPKQVILNARAFAKALAAGGLSVDGNEHDGYTRTHQVVVRIGPGQGREAAALLESSNIITNAQGLYDDPGFARASGLRLGTQEMTRYGMLENDFARLAELMAAILISGKPRAEDVSASRSKFTEMRYCF